ncbi:hypothetical protein [Aliidiomarina maris]|uniref:Uncharacterized protein n=1 Tax=Aliidiomarina maris TaxID=531312 RepID=A0A327X426_9GAMM|nr:hypothetical protein [Aliidiomarina maris]RAK01635.1 hypothetical protein B0I24_101258 [Aliidiomarina maris]RUO28459.1 hypothetical protein CWE07_01230 [Aliidiomarina maris]
MSKNEQATLVMTYKMWVNGNLVTVQRLWSLNAPYTHSELEIAFAESFDGTVEVTRIKTFEL